MLLSGLPILISVLLSYGRIRLIVRLCKCIRDIVVVLIYNRILLLCSWLYLFCRWCCLVTVHGFMILTEQTSGILVPTPKRIHCANFLSIFNCRNELCHLPV